VTLAPFARRKLTVTVNETLGAYRILRVADPQGPKPQAGQFAMLAAVTGWGGGEQQRPYLPRALSIARHSSGESHFMLEDVGPGTHTLCQMAPGEELWALGPLGRPFTPPPPGGRALLVGGGVGTAPLAILQDQLQEEGAVPHLALLGFRDLQHTHGASLLRDARVASDDGSAGHHGLVTDLLREELDSEDERSAVVYACGPPAMLESVRALCSERSTPAQLALEAPMACGFGACFGCAVAKRGGGYLRVCVDGPVVDAHELEFVGDHAGPPTGRPGA